MSTKTSNEERNLPMKQEIMVYGRVDGTLEGFSATNMKSIFEMAEEKGANRLFDIANRSWVMVSVGRWIDGSTMDGKWVAGVGE